MDDLEIDDNPKSYYKGGPLLKKRAKGTSMESQMDQEVRSHMKTKHQKYHDENVSIGLKERRAFQKDKIKRLCNYFQPLMTKATDFVELALKHSEQTRF